MRISCLDALNSGVEGLRDACVGVLGATSRGLNKLGNEIVHGKTPFLWSHDDDDDETELGARKQCTSFPPMDGSSLSFYDDFQPINGVPSFILTPPAHVHHASQSDTPKCEITASSFSTCNTRLVSGDGHGSIFIWDAEHGQLLASKMNLHGAPVVAVAFKGYAEHITLSCDSAGKICEWNLRDGGSVKSVDVGKRHANFEVLSCQILDHGERIVYALDPKPNSTEDIDHARETLQKMMTLERESMHVSDRQVDISVVNMRSKKTEITQVPVDWKIGMYLTQMDFCHVRTRRGLVLGWVNTVQHTSGCYIWPDYQDHPDQRLDAQGTVGRWSQDGDMVATFYPPVEIQPGDTEQNCCFVYSIGSVADHIVQYSREQSGGFPPTLFQTLRPMEPIKVCEADSQSVVWCDFIQDEQTQECVLACGIVAHDREIDIVMWDVKNWARKYRLPSQVRASATSLDSANAWLKEFKNPFPVKGLRAIGTSGDGYWIGLGALHPSSGNNTNRDGGGIVVVWDVRHGVQVLNLWIPDEYLRDLGKNVDILFGEEPGRFALIGPKAVILFTPRSPKPSADHGALVVSLDYGDSKVALNHKAISKFSSNGQKLGVLYEFSQAMHVWDLDRGKSYMVTHDPGSLFCNFTFSPDVNALVTYTNDYRLLYWTLSSEGAKDHAVYSGNIYKMRGGMTGGGDNPCKDIGMFYDSENGWDMIVVCEWTGKLYWIQIVAEEDTDTIQPKGNQQSTLGTMTSAWSRGTLRRVRKFTRYSGELMATMDLESQIHACRFCADGSKAVLIPDSHTVVVWDLVRRVPVQKYDYKVPVGGNKPFPFPDNIAFSGAYAVVGITDKHEGFELCEPETSEKELKEKVKKVPENLTLSENGKLVITDRFGIVKEEVAGSSSSYINKQWSGDLAAKLTIQDINGTSRSKQLCGYHLDPSKILAISPDGRRIACNSDRTSVMVWTAYATDELVPDFALLRLMKRLEHRENVKDLLREYGISLLNYPDHSGMSLLIRALENHNTDVLKLMLGWAYVNKHKVRLRDLGGGTFRKIVDVDKWGNALHMAMGQRSPDTTRQIIKAILLGVTHEVAMAEMFEESMVMLAKMYPRILIDVLESDKIFVDICEVRVPEYAFSNERTLTTTSDQMRPSDEQVQELWKQRAKELDVLGKSKRSVQVPAIAKVIPYPNAASIGQSGVIRSLLMNHVETRSYGAPPLAAIIAYKWEKYGQRTVFSELFHYGVLIACYTAYCLSLGMPDKGPRGTGWGHNPTGRFGLTMLIASMLLALINLVREMKQMKIYWRENRVMGAVYWLASEWNWVELLSYIMVVFVIPIYHFRGIMHSLPAFVAVESILLWWKGLYFARPFRRTGPLVITISQIIRDIQYFLGLMLMVVIGFGVAFFVVYRWVRQVRNGDGGDRHGKSERWGLDEETEQGIEDAFLTFDRTLLTMFAFMMGEFDFGILYNNQPAAGVVVVLFLLYMAIMAILLLNLLIAIMGDSFDRVKNREEVEFLKARAGAIDDTESMMSERKKRQLQSKIKKYVHVLVPLHWKEDQNVGWHGRVLDLQRRFKFEIKKGMKGTRKRLDDVLRRQAHLERAVDMMVNQVVPARQRGALRAPPPSLIVEATGPMTTPFDRLAPIPSFASLSVYELEGLTRLREGAGGISLSDIEGISSSDEE